MGLSAEEKRPDVVDLTPTNVRREDLARLPRMTGWFSPGLLSKLLLRVIISDVFGQYADRRLIQAALDPAGAEELRKRTDLTARVSPDGEGTVWFDYVADLGDGFDSTYAVAYLLAQPELTVDGHTLPRGGALIMGGDQVYPTASIDDYRVRMRLPYTLAFPRDKHNARDVPILLLPGNHDWYDGLVSFLAVFCRQGTLRIGGWRTCQRRSYFAVKLTARWWIWAIDIALVRDMDQPQVDYFIAIAKDMPEHANIILLSAEPGWYKAEAHGAAFRTIAYAVRIARSAKKDLRIPLVLSGDAHHYARYSGGGVQYITSGGGGAFLLGTQQLRDIIHVDLLRKDTSLSLKTTPDERHEPSDTRACYPTQDRSRELIRRNVMFVALNPQFSFLLLGSVYALSSLLVSLRGWATPLAIWDTALVGYLMLFAALFAYAGYENGFSKRVAALTAVHAVAHWSAMLALSWLLWRAAAPALPPLALHGLPWLLVTFAFFIPVGGAVAGTLFGVNLFVTSRWWDINHNDAFSAIRVDGFRNFLRIKLQGDMAHVYPIGLDQVPGRDGWVRNSPGSPEASVFRPAAPLRPHLIEGPVVIRAPAAPTTGNASTETPAPPRAQPQS